MQIASAYHMLSFERPEAYIIIFSVNYNRSQMSVQLRVDYDQFYVFCWLCKVAITYNRFSPLLQILNDSLDYERLLQASTCGHCKQLCRLQCMYHYEKPPTYSATPIPLRPLMFDRTCLLSMWWDWHKSICGCGWVFRLHGHWRPHWGHHQKLHR